jgi:hypothetical protein
MVKNVSILLDKTTSNVFNLFHYQQSDEMKEKLIQLLCTFVHSIPKKFECEPIHARNAFMFYCIDNSENVKSDLHMKSGDIKKLLATKWSAMNDEDKEIYRQKAKEDIIRYENEIHEYSIKNPLWKGKDKLFTKSDIEPKPKKAVSAYNIFLSDAIKEIKRDNPTLSRKEVMQMISKKWGEISITNPDDDGYNIYKICVDKANEDRLSKGYKAIRVSSNDGGIDVAISKSVEIPLTAYKLFLTKFFDEYKNKNPDLNSKQLYKLLREEWRLIRASKLGDSRHKIKQRLEIEVYENRIAAMKISE